MLDVVFLILLLGAVAASVWFSGSVAFRMFNERND